MSLVIKEVSGASGVVCQVNASNGVVVSGFWLGPGVRPGSNLNIQLEGWIDPSTMVQVWTSKGASNIAYRADESKPSYVVSQSGNPVPLWEGPVAPANLALTINDDGSLSMKTC